MLTTATRIACVTASLLTAGPVLLFGDFWEAPAACFTLLLLAAALLYGAFVVDR